MGSLNIKLRESTCSSLLLWSAVLLSHLPSQRLRPRPRLIQLSFTEPMPDTHMLPDMLDIPMDTHMPTVSMERDLLMPSQRLMPTTDTMDMPDLMLMLVTDHSDTQLMELMLMERDPLMLSQRLMLTMAVSMDTHMLLDMPMELTHMPMVSILTTDTTDMPDLTPMDMPDTDMVVMDVS